jgi:hypothetical protein
MSSATATATAAAISFGGATTYITTPLAIPGCALWLDGADPLNNGIQPTSGTAISTWSDKSGNGRNATVASNRIEGTYNTAFNGVYFQSSNVGYVTSYAANPTVETMFIVANIDSPANQNNNTIIGGQRGARSFGFGFSVSGGIGSSSYLNNQVAWQTTSVTGPSAGTTALITGTVSNTSNVTVSLNGATTGASYTAGTITAWTSNTTTYLAVDTTNRAYYYKGYVMEILFYNSVLPTAQRQQIEGYLAWKWRLQNNLSRTHPYANSFNNPGYFGNLGTSIIQPVQFSNTLPVRTGLALWLDAADSTTVVLSNTNVTRWNDKSGNGRHMSNATLSNTPTYNPIGFKNLPTISFSPTTFNFLQNTSFNLNSFPSITLFIIVQRISNTTTFQRFFSAATTIGGADQTGLTQFNLNTSGTNDSVRYERNAPTKAALNTLNPSMIELIINGSSTNIDSFVANTNYIYTNGSLGTSSTGSGNGTNFNLVHVRLGNATFNSSLTTFEQLQGNISEIVMFNRALNLNEFRQTESYLGWKWNLQTNLPTTHPYYNNATFANLPPITNTNILLTAGFRPTSLSGLALWLDAADSASVITSGTTVTRWNDKSGNGYNMSSNTNYGTTTLPTYSSNTANKYVQMAPTQALCSALYNYTTAWSVFVCMNNVIVGERFMVSPYVTVPLVMMSMGLGNNKIWNNAFTTTPTDITGNHIEYTSAENTNALSNLLYYRDGVIQASNVKNMGVAANASAKMGIGANATVNNAMGGTYQVYEILVYNSVLPTTQRQQIEGYLAWKWGLTGSLPTSHPNKYMPP